MTEEINAPISSLFDLISKVQRFFLYLTLFLIPWFIIPLPFDSTEKIKSLGFVILTSILILLEVIKWIWDGRVSVLKSAFDKVFLLLFSTFLLSYVFAQDLWISFWGYDGRMGRGFFVMIFLFMFFFFTRGILQNKKEIINALRALCLGLLILIALSLLSVFKFNIFGWFPYVKDFFVVGLPLTFSFQEIMLISGITTFFSLFLVINSVFEKKYQSMIFPSILLVIALFSIPIFSVNQGALIPVLFYITSLLLSLLMYIKLHKGARVLTAVFFVLTTLVVIFSIGFQFEAFRKSILGDSFTLLNSIRLGSDISWIVASSSIVTSFFRGLVGLGNDSFAIAYNMYRPATEGTVALGNTSFVMGSNELFTTLANRGLLGVIVWIFVGFTLIKEFVKDITESNREQSLQFSMLGIISIFVFLSSIFLPFSFLTYFLFFVTVILLLVYKNREGLKEEFLLKFWAVNVGHVSKDINKTIEGVNWFFTGVLTVLVAAGIILLTLKTVSLAYVVRAESYSIEQNKKYQNIEGEISIEEREEYLTKVANYYDRALRYDSKDPYINRKGSLISVDIINLLSERHNSAKEDEKEAIVSQVSTWKNSAIDLSREAVSTSPLSYANWNTRATVYLSLIGSGFSDYTEDALNALQTCVNINPLDYDAYYKAAQIFMIKEDYDKALNNFTKVLSINGQHVPSLVLAANILNEKGDKENAIAYLDAAKQILEVNKQDSGELYDSIVKSLEELGANDKDEEEANTSESNEEEVTD